jgi:mono/diheme cytochrome c family protein
LLWRPSLRSVRGSKQTEDATSRSFSFAVATTSLFAAVSVSLLVSSGARAAEPHQLEAKKIFNQRCTACHTFGKGVKVGPDLKGVTARRQRPWLLKFIRSSQAVIKSGDPVARSLFAEFKQQRMPDWTDLSEAQVTTILDWLAANGPDQKEPDERSAELATEADLEKARGLWSGRVPLANGGLSCASCHSIRHDDGSKRGGTLGPDLTAAYARYRDRAMTLHLKRPCTKRAPEMSSDVYLTPEESFAIKAYLRRASVNATTASANAGGGSF